MEAQDQSVEKLSQEEPVVGRETERNGTQPGEHANAATSVQTAAATENGASPAEERRPRIFLFVRHGQSTYNVEGRLPGQLEGVALTDEGRRQAQQAAVALASLPLSTVVSSPLERARDTAETIARGFGLTVQLDARLMDTDVGAWSGRKIDELSKSDPNWKAFVEHPTAPPEGVESVAAVAERAVAVVEEARARPQLGNYVVFVAHADVVKVILAHYTGMPLDGIRFMAIGNASLSALAFAGEGQPGVLGINWTPMPQWLLPPALRAAATPETAAQATGQVTAAAESVAGAPHGSTSDAPTVEQADGRADV